MMKFGWFKTQRTGNRYFVVFYNVFTKSHTSSGMTSVTTENGEFFKAKGIIDNVKSREQGVEGVLNRFLSPALDAPR